MRNRFRRNFLILVLALCSILLSYTAKMFNKSDHHLREKFMQAENVKIVIYTKPTCGYCIKAKNFLKDMNVQYDEIDVAQNPELHAELIEQTNSRTVPLIFINDQYIGGCSDMLEMAEDGRLQKLLLVK